jgi:hypothetical protein
MDVGSEAEGGEEGGTKVETDLLMKWCTIREQGGSRGGPTTKPW